MPETDTTAPVAPDSQAPAEPFTLESAFKEARSQAEPPKADAPVASAPDSDKASTPDPDPKAPAPSDQPKGTRRGAGEDAYERGLREGREAAAREATERLEREKAEQNTVNQRKQFEDLLLEANLPDDGTFDTSQRRSAAQQKLGALYASNTVTQSAYQRGQQEYERTFWSGFEGRLTELGLDQAGVDSLMRGSRSAMDFARQLVEHGKSQEKSVWEPEIAKRDAKIEELQGKLAARSASPESANGLRTNGAFSGDIKTIEDAYRAAKALHAG